MTQTQDIMVEKEAAKKDEVQTQSTEQQPQNTSKAPKWLPDFARNAWDGVGQRMAKARRASIEATPAFVVNNSTNFLSASHVATEMLMFKSGMPGNKLIDDPSNPINWVVQPMQKIGRDIFGGKSRWSGVKELFRRSPAENFRQFKDMNAASLREVEQQISDNKALMAAGKTAKPIKLGNPWQTRTTSVGLATFILGAVIPERKETNEEIESMARMRTLNPIRYALHRYKQALWFPEWPKHKRELMGLGYNIIGTVSMLGAWRNRGKLDPAIAEDAKLIAKGLEQGYKFNVGYFFTGLVSFIQGFPLLFALDENKAYSTYGAMTVLRTPMLVKSMNEKYTKQEDGWLSYLIAKVTFQLEDLLFLVIGGATKLKQPDGSYKIIDHEALKKEAIAEAKEEKARIREEKQANPKPRVVDMSLEPTAPANVVTNATNLERAMPEQLAARGEVGNDASVTVAANGR